jgi:hypothetical protein
VKVEETEGEKKERQVAWQQSHSTWIETLIRGEKWAKYFLHYCLVEEGVGKNSGKKG